MSIDSASQSEDALLYDNHVRYVIGRLLFFSNEVYTFILEDRQNLIRLAHIIHNIAVENDYSNLDLLINLTNIVFFDRNAVQINLWSTLMLARYADQIARYDHNPVVPNHQVENPPIVALAGVNDTEHNDTNNEEVIIGRDFISSTCIMS